ncbi:phage tail assembly chaperone [Cereibacter azotoformans]|uniref:phage tail assembly chaperone n=1 Tax=Cereibacter azotoformans TaxID=43057 RepID=UPI003B20D237
MATDAAMNRLKRQMCAALAGALAGGNPPVPEAGALLWRAFWQLSRCRTLHAAGPNPIGWAEMEAWCRLMRVPLEPQHVEIIAAMDDAWLDHAYASRGARAAPVKSSQPLTPQIMDALFG